MSQYEKLLAELGGITMAKALPADDGKGDQKIQAAAEGGGEGDPEVKKEGEGEGEGKPMAKSMQVTLADGTVVEAEDGTELVKSLTARIDANEDASARALELTVNLLKSQAAAIAEQGTLIKSLQDKLASVSNEGKGRKTIVSVIEKTGAADLVKSEQPKEGLTNQEFLTKSMAAFNSGKITGIEANTIDVSLRNSVQIDPALVAKVLA